MDDKIIKYQQQIRKQTLFINAAKQRYNNFMLMLQDYREAKKDIDKELGKLNKMREKNEQLAHSTQNPDDLQYLQMVVHDIHDNMHQLQSSKDKFDAAMSKIQQDRADLKGKVAQAAQKIKKLKAIVKEAVEQESQKLKKEDEERGLFGTAMKRMNEAFQGKEDPHEKLKELSEQTKEMTDIAENESDDFKHQDKKEKEKEQFRDSKKKTTGKATGVATKLQLILNEFEAIYNDLNTKIVLAWPKRLLKLKQQQNAALSEFEALMKDQDAAIEDDNKWKQLLFSALGTIINVVLPGGASFVAGRLAGKLVQPLLKNEGKLRALVGKAGKFAAKVTNTDSTNSDDMAGLGETVIENWADMGLGFLSDAIQPQEMKSEYNALNSSKKTDELFTKWSLQILEKVDDPITKTLAYQKYTQKLLKDFTLGGYSDSGPNAQYILSICQNALIPTYMDLKRAANAADLQPPSIPGDSEIKNMFLEYMVCNWVKSLKQVSTKTINLDDPLRGITYGITDGLDVLGADKVEKSKDGKKMKLTDIDYTEVVAVSIKKKLKSYGAPEKLLEFDDGYDIDDGDNMQKLVAWANGHMKSKFSGGVWLKLLGAQ